MIITTRGYETFSFFFIDIAADKFIIPAQDWTPQALLDFIAGRVNYIVDTSGFNFMATYDEATGKTNWSVDYALYTESESYIEASSDLSQVLGFGGSQIVPALVKPLNFGVTYSFF
jgi:hypothetical protein